jgi:hypothetical protein
MELDVEKGLIPAHDVVGAGSNCGLQEFVIIWIAANGLGKRDRINDLRVELDNFENGIEHRHLPLFGKLIEDATVLIQNGQRYRWAKALFLHALRISNGGPFQNTPEMKTFVSRIALIFTLCDGGLWQSQTSDLPF